MFSPTELDLKSLPWLPLQAKSAFPKEACIYFALDCDGNPLYIGRSINVRQRWRAHHKYDELSSIEGVRVAYLFIDTHELLPSIESALIEYFDPPLNRIREAEYLSRKKKPTVTRSIRFLEEVATLLNKYADDQMISTSAALNKLLKERLVQLGYEVKGNK